MLGRAGSWVGASSASVASLTDARLWLYQDFAAASGPGLTITGNSNGTGIVFDSSRIVNSSAVVTDTDGNPIYSSSTETPANLVKVSAHTGTSVTLNGTPDVGQGSVRVWYLYAVKSSDDTTDVEIAPRFVKELRTEYLDLQYLNALLNLSDLNNAATARTNLGFTAQTAGQVLFGDGSTTFTSEANLFWDSSNDRLGIGTNTPSQKLHIINNAASPVALIETQFTGGVPEVRFQAARTSNADLATNDDVGAISFYARYNSTTALVAQIYGEYTGSGTTQLGDIVFTTSNAGSAAERVRIAASGRTTVQTTLAANTSVITPIIYGSESASGSLTLRSTSNATKGNIYVADQTSEKIVAGVQNLVTTFNMPFNFIVPASSSATNGLGVYENSKTQFNAGSGSGNAEGWAILPRGPSGAPEIRVTNNGGTDAYIRPYDTGFGTLYGYLKIGSTWGFQNHNAGIAVFDVSGTNGQTAYLTRWSNQTTFSNFVSGVGPDGHFRGPAGSVSLPAFAGFGDTDTGMWFPAANTLAWSLGGAEAARLDSAGLLLKTALVIEDSDAGTNTITIQAPTTLSANYTLTLPTTDGNSGEFLATDGSGVLSWSRPNGQKAGTVTLTSGTTTKAITFATARADANYSINWAFKNTVDGSMAKNPWGVIAQSTTGFTVEWNDSLPTGNYIGLWSIEDHYDP